MDSFACHTLAVTRFGYVGGCMNYGQMPDEPGQQLKNILIEDQLFRLR